jgi:hypothetical protein
LFSGIDGGLGLYGAPLIDLLLFLSGREVGQLLPALVLQLFHMKVGLLCSSVALLVPNAISKSKGSCLRRLA